jgi:hypothetical protein
MMELLLARMNASIKEHMQEMTARMEINQAKLEVERKVDQEHMQDMLARIDTNRETDCKALKEIQAKTKDMMESQIGFLVSRMEADRETDREEMKTAIQSIQSELDETIQQRVENIMTRVNHKTQSLQKACQETIACHEVMEACTEKIQSDPRMMQSVVEHEEVPKEEAEVMPVGGLRKRSGDRNPATRRRQKPKGRIQAGCESRKRLTVAGRRMTHCAGVAWLRRNVVRKDWTRNQAERGTPKRREDGERLWKGPECNNGIRDRGLREQLQSRMRIEDLGGRRPQYLRKERTTSNGIRRWSSGQ